MHDNRTVDLHAGYEWWLMSQAKKRQPGIKYAARLLGMI